MFLESACYEHFLFREGLQLHSICVTKLSMWPSSHLTLRGLQSQLVRLLRGTEVWCSSMCGVKTVSPGRWYFFMPHTKAGLLHNYMYCIVWQIQPPVWDWFTAGLLPLLRWGTSTICKTVWCNCKTKLQAICCCLESITDAAFHYATIKTTLYFMLVLMLDETIRQYINFGK